MRAWSGLIRIATVLAPVAILVFWGGSYLLACAEFLANPGVPLRMGYKTPGGELLITADSYVLNTKSGDLTVVKPRVSDPKGAVLFYADRIEALGLPLLVNETRRAVVTAKNAYATVQRRPDGKLDILDYLPKQEGPSGDFPFTINLDRGTVKYVELSGAERYVQNVTLSNLYVDGVGDRWLASANATLQDVGDVTMSVQNHPVEGLWVRGNTDRLEIADLFRAFRDTPEGKKTKELADLDVSSLVVKGPFEVYVPSKAGARIQAQVVAEAENFRYGRDYQAQRLQFEGVASAEGVQGKLTAFDNGLDAEFEGIAKWEEEFQIDGHLNADTNSLASLPASLRQNLPKQLTVKGPVSFDGRLAYTDASGWTVNGVADAGSIAAYDETVQRPSVSLDYSKAGLTLATRTGTWRGAPIDGNVAFDARSRNLSGNLVLKQLNLDGLAQRFKIDRLHGVGDFHVVLTGTAEKPVAFIRADSRATYAVNANSRPNAGRFTLAATLKDNRIRFDQAYIVSQAGSISANGTYDLKSKALSFDAVGSGIDLDKIDAGLEGIGRFKAKIGGTLDKPKYQGTAELFGLKIQDQPVPIITGAFTGDLRSLTANNLRAVKGASQAQGEVSLRFKDMALDGKFQALGVQLSDFLGDNYLATIDLPDARLSGTLAKPTFNATASAKEIVILGSKVDMANAVVSFKNDLLEVDDFSARKGAGTVQGFLSYDVGKRFGQANFTADKLAVQDFLPPDMGAHLTAELTGEAGLTFDANGLKLGSGEGKFANVVLNDTPIGTGDWKVSADGMVAKGELFVGGLTSSIDLTGLTYEMETKRIGGNLWIRNVPVEDLYKIANPYLPVMEQNLTTLLQQARGTVGLSTDFGGTIENLDLSNGVFSAENLISGPPDSPTSAWGTIKSSFGRKGKRWEIDSFVWTGGPIGVDAKGSFVESGPVDIEGKINDADISYLSILDKAFTNWVGRIDADFSLDGTAKEPVLRATPFSDNQTKFGGIGISTPVLDEKGKQVFDADGKPAMQLVNPFNFAFSELKLSNWKDGIGGAEGRASMNLAGYSGEFTMNLPFRFPFDLVPGAPVVAGLVLNQRSIKDIEQLAGTLDPAQSEGEVKGAINVSGTKENLKTVGNVNLTAPKVVLKNGGQEFNDVNAEVIFQPNLLATLINGNSATGGSFVAKAEAKIPTLDEIIRGVREGNLEALWNSPLEGAVNSTNLTAKIPVGVDGSASGALKTDLKIGGNLRQPEITGEAEIDKGSMTMPTEFGTEGGSFVFPFNPLLNVTLRTGTPMKFKTSTADIDMNGSGTIQGTLDALDVDARLRVTKGQLRLPTARVNLTPGGSIRPSLTIQNGVTNAQVDVDLEGKTRVVTSSRYGQGAQRYDITLDVRGDLLKDGGLNLTASSDPPELNQDEILALLGQVSVIEGLAGGFQSGDAEAQIRGAFINVALPYLLDPFTSRLANAFGLDYLTLDINALEGTTIYFAKTLGNYLVLEGSRQVSQVNNNYPIKYDLRLSYQYRFGRRGDRRRLNFLVGLDELRPWKIAVEYTFRF